MGGLGSYFWRGGYELRRPAEDEGVVSSSEAPETTELGNEERRSKRRRTTNGEHEIGEEEGGDDVSGKSGFEAGPSDADLAPGDEAADANDLGGVVGRLWELEQPHRIPVELNSGARAASLYAQIDRCDKPLFATIGLDRLQGDPLSRAFIALLDNYCRDTNAAEKETDAEKKEILMFLKLMKRTPHFRYVHNVLASWGRAEKRMDEFMDDVYRAWFATYRLTKGGPPASSGFEHVFVGEEKYDSRRGKYTISGFHNWMQFYLEETQRRVNYLGYVGHNVSGGEEDLVVSARFLWEDNDEGAVAKSVSTFLVGTSIAFDFSLATLAFFALDDDGSQIVPIGGHDLKLHVYKWNSQLGTHVRTVYLEV